MKRCAQLTGAPLPEVGTFKPARPHPRDNCAENKKTPFIPSYEAPGVAQLQKKKKANSHTTYFIGPWKSKCNPPLSMDQEKRDSEG